MERLGVSVVTWTRPLARLPIAEVGPNDWLALLDVSAFGDPLNDVDVGAILDWLDRGGGVLLVGRSRAATCVGAPVNAGTVVVPMRDERLPETRWRIEDPDDAAPEEQAVVSPVEMRCASVETSKTVHILRNQRGAPVVRLDWLEGDARVLTIAEPDYLRNRTLRDRETGTVLLPLLLAERPARVFVDEYDHGFGAHPSLYGATWSWMRSRPAGWAMLHLGVVGLLALAVLAVRFGPALSVIERRRRSPLEHLDALAVGLERAKASGTAIELIVQGLQRRLGRAGAGRRAVARSREWLDALALSAQSAPAKAAVASLAQALKNRGDPDSVSDAALAVEDVWEALQHSNSKTR
jgi:hypothetical protein